MTRNQQAGFTLVEMAVAMVVAGLVMLTIFPALTALMSANERMTTQSNLHNLMLATAAYVQANGCLPCPAVPSNAGTGANFGKIGTATPCGAGCAAEGFVPFMSLGVPAATARDGWGHWITMRVDTALTVLPSNAANCGTNCSVFAPPAAACTAQDVANGFCTSVQIGFADKGLCRSGIATTNRILVSTPNGGSQQAAVIFVSYGSTGYGSFFVRPQSGPTNGAQLPFTSEYLPCSATGGFSECNASQTTQFYDAPTVAGTSDPYNDMLAYADRNNLVGMLSNSGCQTVW